jgi:hypothetical protein
MDELEDLGLATKARERDLLAIIASKDKRIQQLEEKLEAQTAFIEAVLKLSDTYRDSTHKGRRRVSWCDSVDQLPARLFRSSSKEITVDCVRIDETDMDELSILSDDERIAEDQDTEQTSSTDSESESTGDSEPELFSTPRVEVRKKKPNKAESKLIQSIIERIRDDSDSVSV